SYSSKHGHDDNLPNAHRCGNIAENGLHDVVCNSPAEENQHRSFEERIVDVTDASDHPHKPDQCDGDLGYAPHNIKNLSIEKLPARRGKVPVIISANKSRDQHPDSCGGSSIRVEVPPQNSRVIHRDKNPGQC